MPLLPSPARTMRAPLLVHDTDATSSRPMETTVHRIVVQPKLQHDDLSLPPFLSYASPMQLLLTYIVTVASLTISAAISLCLVHLYQPTATLSDALVEFLAACWGFSPAIGCLVVWLRYKWWLRQHAAASSPLLTAHTTAEPPSPTSSMFHSQQVQIVEESAIDAHLHASRASTFQGHRSTTVDDASLPSTGLSSLWRAMTHRQNSVSPTSTFSEQHLYNSSRQLTSLQLRIIGYTLAVCIPLGLASLNYVIACSTGSTQWSRKEFVKRWATILDMDAAKQSAVLSLSFFYTLMVGPLWDMTPPLSADFNSAGPWHGCCWLLLSAGEELGWAVVLYPLLRKLISERADARHQQYSWLIAAIITGMLWSSWHLLFVGLRDQMPMYAGYTPGGVRTPVWYNCLMLPVVLTCCRVVMCAASYYTVTSVFGIALLYHAIHNVWTISYFIQLQGKKTGSYMTSYVLAEVALQLALMYVVLAATIGAFTCSRRHTANTAGSVDGKLSASIQVTE